MHACVYILHTVVKQFLLQIAAWMSWATSFPSVIDLPTLKSSSFKSCLNLEEGKDSKTGPGCPPVSDVDDHVAFVKKKKKEAS